VFRIGVRNKDFDAVKICTVDVQLTNQILILHNTYYSQTS
jgi:hypothetical protein